MLSFKLSLAVLSIPFALATTITTDAGVASGHTFDYVVAGAGLSGIVVGTKLSARGYNVLLIEAGKDLQNNSAIYNAELRSNLNSDPATDCNWHYVASDVNGSALPVTIDSGKCIGGSSSINGMVWYRPTSAELDAIGGLGNPGWNSTTLFPYMKAIEHNIPPSEAQRADGANLVPSFHGFDGPVNVSFPVPMRIPEAQAIYKAAIALVFGIPDSPDLSARNGSVSASTSWTIWWDPVAQFTRRASAAYSLLYPRSKQQKTLTVLAEHKVAKVIFDKNMKATGLQFASANGGAFSIVNAKFEVLLAAGSLATPPILERSGVGSKSVLSKVGIKQLVDLPGVGLNLQDQPGTALSASVQTANVSDTLLIDNRGLFGPVITLLNIDQLFGNKSTRLSQQLQDNIAARAKAAVAAGTEVNLVGATKLFTTVTDLITKNKMPITELLSESSSTIMTSVFWPLTPLSRGHIHIHTSDPFASPRITPRFLSDDFDVETAVKIAQKARDLYTTFPFQPIISEVVIDAVPANATDNDWAKWYRDTSFGASHWLGSCAMRPRASGGVVSPTLEVYGTSGLRVVDASVIPFQVTSHTMSTIYAVSQKAADLILASR
ncbi:alcohol oxidase [Mycena albidolilacea]|uniref:Alcohol oxidase n=1 Tax=Mycena albidolilacea TaxID=1033008 RepID=A0AAD7EWC7_9AGAR|nr:alcohol oxidase [Mycena albidolilacea]